MVSKKYGVFDEHLDEQLKKVQKGIKKRASEVKEALL